MYPIEPATPQDLPALCDLLSILFSQEAEFHPEPKRQHRGLLQLLQTPEAATILVARHPSGQPVGMVVLLYTVSTALGDPVAWLEDMVVQPGCRSQGTGTALLQAALQTARERGCQRITLLTDQDNQRAQRFYARQGFGPSPMQPMRLML